MIHQGSEAWHLQRVGKVTASRVHAVFTQPRKGSSVSKVRESYLADLLAERLLTVAPQCRVTATTAATRGPLRGARRRRPFR